MLFVYVPIKRPVPPKKVVPPQKTSSSNMFRRVMGDNPRRSSPIMWDKQLAKSGLRSLMLCAILVIIALAGLELLNSMNNVDERPQQKNEPQQFVPAKSPERKNCHGGDDQHDEPAVGAHQDTASVGSPRAKREIPGPIEPTTTEEPQIYYEYLVFEPAGELEMFDVEVDGKDEKGDGGEEVAPKEEEEVINNEEEVKEPEVIEDPKPAPQE
jgi:hypothetical protein